jgi:hypothetical protein
LHRFLSSGFGSEISLLVLTASCEISNETSRTQRRTRFQIQIFSEKPEVCETRSLCRIRSSKEKKYCSLSESLTASFRSKKADLSSFWGFSPLFPEIPSESGRNPLYFFLKDATNGVEFEEKILCHPPDNSLLLTTSDSWEKPKLLTPF